MKQLAKMPAEPQRAGGPSHAAPLVQQERRAGWGNQEQIAALGERTKPLFAPEGDPAEQAADRLADAYVATAASRQSMARADAASGGAVRPSSSGDGLAPSSQASQLVCELPELNNAQHGAATPLPKHIRQPMEAFFNADLSRVRVHTDMAGAAAARAVNARAYAHGDHLMFAQGQYEPHSPAGQRLLAHEVAHVVLHGDGKGEHQAHRQPDQPTTTPPPQVVQGAPAKPILQDLIRGQPPGFFDPTLESAYQTYIKQDRNSGDPVAWALRQTVGAPRERLVQLLGADYARGQRSSVARPAVDVTQVNAPAGYTPARQQQDLQALQAQPGTVTNRMGNMLSAPETDMSLSAGHFSILQGNVGEALARPLLEQALLEAQKKNPNARLYLGARAQLFRHDGSLTEPVLFTDGLIASVEAGGLRLLGVAEIKSGTLGGVQGQEQVHRWIEAHSTSGLIIHLPGMARTFEYSENKREVLGLTTAPRLLIAPSDAQFAGQASGHRSTAPIVKLNLPQSAAEVHHLTRMVAQRLLLLRQARNLLAQVMRNQLLPANVASTLELQSPKTMQSLMASNAGLALVNGQLYRVSTGGESGPRITRLPLSPVQLPQLAAGEGPASGAVSGLPAPLVQQPPAPNPNQASVATIQGPGAGGALATRPAPLSVPGIPGFVDLAPGTGTLLPTNVMNFSDQDIIVGGRVIAPSEPITLRAGDYVVNGYSGMWNVLDMRTGRPIAALQQGGEWYVVVSGNRVVPLDSEGRARTEVEPIALTELPPALRPTGAAAVPTPRSGGMRVAAGGLGLFVVANEILAPMARNLQQQRANIAFGKAQIDFWVQFGGNPSMAVWDIWDHERAAEGVEADTSVLGSGSFPYVVDVDIAAFARTLPGLITNYRDFLLFLDLAKTLSTIYEKPTMPGEPSAEERRQPRRYYVMFSSADRSLRREVDVTDIIAPLGQTLLGQLDQDMRGKLAAMGEGEQQKIMRLRHGSETPLFRSARGGQPILSDQQLLGDDPWVRPLGRELDGGAYQWFMRGQYRDRVLVAPANADAQRAAVVSAYVIKSEIDDVYEEVKSAGRPITHRSPPAGDVDSFTAGPEPGATSRFGETRYYRHPNFPEVRWTAAIGELHEFWVNARDLEPVALQTVRDYANPKKP